MKIPLSLICEHLEIGLPLKTLKERQLVAKKLSSFLLRGGIEVEKIEYETAPFSHVVVGQIESVEKHPSSDHLSLTTVSDGTQIFPIVCGAPNCKKGMRVALAKIGATLLDENQKVFEIKKAKLRGIESFGMLCSAKELSLAKESNQILELPETLLLGEDLADLLIDPIFEISLTPNLGHCMSALGLARELSALMGKPLKNPPIFLKETSFPLPLKGTIENSKACQRYMGFFFKNITICPSPFWLSSKLEASGIRSINAVVDALNYAMLEYGHPLHGFDADLIEGKELFVTSSKTFEKKLVCLDHIERDLPSGTLLITDTKKVLAIAGIIGGLIGSVQLTTKNLWIEGALFSPMEIRRASKKLELKTDSSLRFERGVDPNGILTTLQRACELIQTICGGECSSPLDLKQTPFLEKTVSCRMKRIHQVLGYPLSKGEIASMFERLGCKILKEEKEEFFLSIPTYRNDLLQEIDLIEELAKIYGYDALEKPGAACRISPVTHQPFYLFEKEIRKTLLRERLQEWMTCDLISPKMVSLFKEDSFLEKNLLSVLHYKSKDQSILRPSLIAGFLQTAKLNLDRKNLSLSSFEIGHIYFKKETSYCEQSVAAVLLSGTTPHHWSSKNESPQDFFALKGILENLLFSQGLSIDHWKPSDHLSFHSGRQAILVVNGEEIGVCGEIHPTILSQLDISQRIVFAELNLDLLFKLKTPEQSYIPLSVFPGSERDWTVPLPEKFPIENFFQEVKNSALPLLEKIELLDLYQNPTTPQIKNASFRFFYRDKLKTLTFEEVEFAHAKITQEIEKHLKRDR